MATIVDSTGLDKGWWHPCCLVSGLAKSIAIPVWYVLLCICLLSPEQTLQVLSDLVRKARSRNIGIFHPSFNIGKFLRQDLYKYLPANVHQLISGKICVSLTRVSDGENVLVSDFQSKDEVVDVSSLLIWMLYQVRKAVFR